jgi:hypothetical protein
MIAAAIVSEMRLDLGAFMQSARSLTGKNHVEATDACPRPSQLANDLSILRDFCGRDQEAALHALGVGVLLAGPACDLVDVMEYCSGMDFLRTTLCLRQEIECILLTGNLAQWRAAVNHGCRGDVNSTTRTVFNSIYQQFFRKGIGELFYDSRPKEQNDGTFLLLENK